MPWAAASGCGAAAVRARLLQDRAVGPPWGLVVRLGAASAGRVARVEPQGMIAGTSVGLPQIGWLVDLGTAAVTADTLGDVLGCKL